MKNESIGISSCGIRLVLRWISKRNEVRYEKNEVTVCVSKLLVRQERDGEKIEVIKGGTALYRYCIKKARMYHSARPKMTEEKSLLCGGMGIWC